MPIFPRTRSRSNEAVAAVYPNAAGPVFGSGVTGPELGRRGAATAPTVSPAFIYSPGSGGAAVMTTLPATDTVAACAQGVSNDAGGHDGPGNGEVPRAATNAQLGHGRDGEPAKPVGAVSPTMKPMQMKVRLSFRTDIGGMVENQDNCFIWRHEPSGSFVIGVFDGHGRDVGRLAAQVVQVFMQDWLTRRWGEVKKDPAEAFRTLFREAHASMLVSFREHLEGLGWTVKEHDGYLMKRRSMTQPWSCVHGGTSASLVALVEGTRLYTANVGDSSALMGMTGRHLVVEDLIQRSMWKDGGGVMETCREPGTVGDLEVPASVMADVCACKTLLLTADHSPESIREFERMRLTHPANPPSNSHTGSSRGGVDGGYGGGAYSGPRVPRLLVVYDSPTSNKLKCASVFDVDHDGKARITGKGRYYKNVRKEWASLVATPLSARFQDALAFTRSIGDFHLQAYGVSHVPDVMSLDLHDIFHREQKQGRAVPDKMVVCLVAASDGVWDNWVYADVAQYFLEPARVAEVMRGNSAEGVTEAFMRENSRRARANFGSQADNATCIACYLIISLDE